MTAFDNASVDAAIAVQLAQQHDAANLEALRAIVAGDAPLDFEGNPPAERVQAYLDAIDEHDKRSHMQYGDAVHTYNDKPLERADLRDLLLQLHECSETLGEIDAALDGNDPLTDIRRIMGRSSE